MSRKKGKSQEDEGGVMFTPARLYDGEGKEIGVTCYTHEAIVYAMAHSERIQSAKTVSPLFGSEEIKRSDVSEKMFAKVRNNHKLGECLLFWG